MLKNNITKIGSLNAERTNQSGTWSLSHEMSQIFCGVSFTRKSRCTSRIFETTNRAKLLDFDLYTESKSIRSITKNTRSCA